MQKPAYSMSIVPIRAGKTVPEGLLFKLLSENKSAIGFVVRNAEGLDVEKFDDLGKSVEKTTEDWEGILETTMKFDRKLCLMSFPEKFNPGEIQPWVILKDSKNKPLLVVSCEGDFPKYAKEGQSEFFSLINDYLGPKIEGLYKLLGNDMKKLTEYLRGKDFAADLEQVTGHRGVFEFMPLEGEPFVQLINAEATQPIGGQFDWGRASNIYGYTESVQGAGTAEPPPVPVEGPKRSKYASDEPAKSVPTVTPPKADPPTAPIEKVAAELPKQRRIDIPRNLHGKRKKAFIRDLYMTHYGKEELPPDWDNMTFVMVDMETTVKSLADLDKTAAGAEVKDMRAAAQPELKSNVAQGMPVPVISGAQQAAAVGFIKKHLDGNSNRVENPLEIQKIESKLAVFTEVAGLTMGLDDIDSWPTSVVAAFVKEHPEAAWLLILEYRAERRKRKQLMAAGDKKLSDLTGTEEVPTKPGTTAPVSPEPGTVSPPKVAEPEFKKSKYA